MRPLYALAALALVSAASAQPSDLFFSEYVEGSGFNKAVEIYNGTGEPVDLSGYSLELYSNGNSEPNATEDLAGTLADGDVYVVSNSQANDEVKAASDLESGVANFNGDDAVVLRGPGGVLDVIGQVGFDPGSEWGSGDTSTANNTIRRKAASCAGDTNPSDAFDPAVDYDGFPSNTTDGLGSHTASCDGGPVNSPPSFTAALQSQTVEAGTLFEFDYDAQDADDEDVLTFALEDGPASATFDAATGAFAWTPADGDKGQSFTVSVTVSDGAATTSTTATLMVASDPVAGGRVFFSEYVEGSSNNKALEILNATEAAIDLSGYTVELYSNGATTPSQTETLSGTLDVGEVFVIANASAAQPVLDQADVTSSVTFFNGDDAVVLRGPDGVVDVIGQVGFRPDSEWGSGDASTQDNTLRRKADSCTGDTDPGDAFDPAVDYDGFAQDTFGGLGSYDGTCVEDGGVADPSELLITEVVVTPTGGEFVEVYNPTGSAVDLSDVYLTDATFANGGVYYYNVVTGGDAGGGGFGDFHARFPDGAAVVAGGYVTVAIAGSDDFAAEFGVAPDFELYEDGPADDVPDMREALPGSINGQGGLTNSGEVVVLYHWNGTSDLVTDLDYVLWGDKAEAVDKTGVSVDGPDADTEPSTYASDTMVSAQAVVSDGSHGDGFSFSRTDLSEGAETEAGGNGVGGQDETSEDLGATFSAELTPSPGAPTVVPVPRLVVNEIDYDQVGTDDAEYVELYNAGAAGLDLGDYNVVLVNGNGGAVYDSVELPAVELDAGAFFVVCGDLEAVLGCDLEDAGLSVQNGPDAVVVTLRADGSVVDALSYEGPVAGYVEGAATTAADSDTEPFVSLSRTPDGADTGDNDADFTLRCATPGAGNSLETSGCPPPAPLGFTAVLASGFVGSGSAVTFDYDASGNGVTFELRDGPEGAAIDPASGVFSWTASSTPGVFPVRVAVTDGSATRDTTSVLGVRGTLFPGESGSTLRASIRDAYSPDQTLGYGTARDTMYAVIDREPDGSVVGVYTGFAVDVPFTEADVRAYVQDRGINAEHTWPQSKGARDEPGRSDIHNLFPANASANSARGNLPLLEIPDAFTDRWYRGDTATETAPPEEERDSYSEVDDFNGFEPREVHEGDAARAAAYFFTIYEPLADVPFLVEQRDAFELWDDADPADADELVRTYEISVRQGNVNPFLLDPTLLDRAIGDVVPPAPLDVTIADARGLDNGTAVTVRGVVTRARGRFVRLQQEVEGVVTGITLFQQNGSVRAAVEDGAIAPGDSLRVTGELSTFNALRQIEPTSFEVLSRDHGLPAPQVVTLAELDAGGEAYESELVRVAGLRVDAQDATFAANTSYTVTDGQTTLVLRTGGADDSEIVGEPVPDGEVVFQGVVGDFRGGYQLVPVLATDVRAATVTAVVSFASAQRAVSEDAGSVTLEVEVEGDPDGAVTVEVALVDGDPDDLGGFTSTEVEVGGGAEVAIPVTDDARVEGDERFVFALRLPDGDDADSDDADEDQDVEVVLGRDDTVVIVVDNDGQAVTVAVPNEAGGPRAFAVPVGGLTAGELAEIAGADSVYVVGPAGALEVAGPDAALAAGQIVVVDVSPEADLSFSGSAVAPEVQYRGQAVGLDGQADRALVAVGNPSGVPVALSDLGVEGGTLADVALVFDRESGSFRPVSLGALEDAALGPFGIVVLQVVLDGDAETAAVTVATDGDAADGAPVSDAAFAPTEGETAVVLALRPSAEDGLAADDPGDTVALRFGVGADDLDAFDGVDVVSPFGATLAALEAGAAPFAAVSFGDALAAGPVTVPLVLTVLEPGSYDLTLAETPGEVDGRPVVVEVLDGTVGVVVEDGAPFTFEATDADVRDGTVTGRFAVRVSLRSSVAGESALEGEAGLAVYPNPTAGPATVAFQAVEAGPVRVAVYDMLGREVAVLHDGPATGVVHVALPAGRLAPGAYVVRADGTGLGLARRLTVTR